MMILTVYLSFLQDAKVVTIFNMIAVPCFVYQGHSGNIIFFISYFTSFIFFMKLYKDGIFLWPCSFSHLLQRVVDPFYEHVDQKQHSTLGPCYTVFIFCLRSQNFPDWLPSVPNVSGAKN